MGCQRVRHDVEMEKQQQLSFLGNVNTFKSKTILIVFFCPFFSSVQFSHSVMSNSLQLHELQHARPPCPSPVPGVCSDSCPLSWWCHPNISSSVIHFSRLWSFPAKGSFQMSQALRIRWPKYWNFSFSINPSNEYSGLISFKMNSLNLLAVQRTLTPQFKSINSLVFSFLYSPSLTSIHDYWEKKKIALTRQTFVGKVMSLSS